MRIRAVPLGRLAPVALMLAAVLAAACPPAAAAPVPLFRLSDARLAEASGLAVGHRSPGVLYVQDDSGAGPRFYALGATTGAVRAVCTVPDARNVDWEDLATGPDRAGNWSVWLADIGDNRAVRSEVRIYRVPEPAVGSGSALTTGRPDVWRLRYPDGPHDAESLVADPVGRRLYVITKSLFGQSEVFEVPPSPDPNRVQPMVRVGSIRFALTGTPGGPNPVGQLTATGASMAADGSLLAVRTYTDAYLWRVHGGRVAEALRGRPARLPLPAQPQGEGIAVADGALLVDSEGVGSPVYRVPLPASVLAQPSPPGPSSSPSPSSSLATGSPARSSPSATSAGTQAATPPTSSYRAWLISTATVAAFAAVALLARRRRRDR